jgi:hypothetical protein
VSSPTINQNSFPSFPHTVILHPVYAFIIQQQEGEETVSGLLPFSLQAGDSSVQPEKVKEYADPDDQCDNHGNKV